MGNINGWQRNFILRCEAVGWSVERGGSDHYKVRDQNGKFLFSFGSTSSDQHALKKTVADAKRAGIEQLETLIKLRNEHDRLTRIETDRQANDAALTKITTESPTTQSVMSDGTLGDVDGVAIVATAPAKIKTPIMLKAAPLADAQELLLANDRVVFRCLKPAATPGHPELTGICHRTFETADSLRSHITFHTRMSLSPQPQKDTPKPARESRVPTSNMVKPPVTAAKPPVTAASATGAAVTTEDLALRLETALKTIERVAATVATVKLDLTQIGKDLRQLPQADPVILAKARQFDALRGIFTDSAGS